MRRMLICLAVMLVAVPAAADQKPKTKIGLLHLGGGELRHTAKTLFDTGNMPVLKCEDMAKIAYYKQHNPNGIVDYAMVGESFDTSNDDPEQAAQKRWAKYLSPRLLGFTPGQKALIDYVEVSPNMREPHSVEEAKWWNCYSAVLCKLVGDAGYKPIIFTIGVGGLPCGSQTGTAILEAMIPALRAAHKYGGGWAYHGYSLGYTTDLAQERVYSLRYRQAYELFKTKAPDLMTMPIILSEGGADYRGDPRRDGYAYRGSREDFAKWLAWYDSEIKKDPYVVGVTLFKIGGSGWESFDLDPMTPWLAHYYKTGSMDLPKPATKLGMFVLGEESMSDAARKVCMSKAPIIYTDWREVRPGGAVDIYKRLNSKGLVVVDMRASLPDPKAEPDPKVAARKRWDQIVQIIIKWTDEQWKMVDFVDATPGPVKIESAEQAKYFNNYMDVLTQLLRENRFRPIVAAFDVRTLPISEQQWDILGGHFKNIWRDRGRVGGAVIYQAEVTSPAKDVQRAESDVLKYRLTYRHLLKFDPDLLATPVIIIPESRCTPNGMGGAFTPLYRDWLEWYDSEVCKDTDALGIAAYKIGKPQELTESDLSPFADWYVSYVNSRAAVSSQ